MRFVWDASGPGIDFRTKEKFVDRRVCVTTNEMEELFAGVRAAMLVNVNGAINYPDLTCGDKC